MIVGLITCDSSRYGTTNIFPPVVELQNSSRGFLNDETKMLGGMENRWISPFKSVSTWVSVHAVKQVLVKNESMYML